MRREPAFPVPRFASAPGLTFAPAFGGDLDLVADLRGLLARDVRLAFGFALAGMRTGPGRAFIMMAAVSSPADHTGLPRPL